MKHIKKNILKIASLTSVLTTAASFAQTTATPIEYPTPAQQAHWQNCTSQLAKSPAFKKITSATFQKTIGAIQPDMSVLTHLNKQPEFTMPVWDYMAMLVDKERVNDGVENFAKWQSTFQAQQKITGVSAPIIAGVWGVESNFGQTMGKRGLIQSLGTLSCFGRRQDYFKGELAAAMLIIQQGHVNQEKMQGSWAGAFGQTQFMPSTFLTTAKDGDGDGRADIVDSVPDAIASTANFLKKAGWKTDQIWGIEVKLPAGYTADNAGRKNKKPIAHWKNAGITLANGQPLPASLNQTLPSAGLLIPAKKQDKTQTNTPAFLVGTNFDALYRYNASENYALAIAHLADNIAGKSQINFAQAWPTDDAGLSRAQNKELQSMLIMRGYDIGRADGIMGEKTRDAIKQEQSRLGQTATGRAGQKLYKKLIEN